MFVGSMITTRDPRHLFQNCFLFFLFQQDVVHESIFAATSTANYGGLKQRCDRTLGRGDEVLIQRDEQHQHGEAATEAERDRSLVAATRRQRHVPFNSMSLRERERCRRGNASALAGAK